MVAAFEGWNDAADAASGTVDHLIEEGAEVVICDVNEQAIDRVRRRHPAVEVVGDAAELITADLDIYAPCALGGSLNDETAPRLRAKIVCGAANNQLAHPGVEKQLAERGILYAPDYVINAGGIINVSTEYLGDGDYSLVRERIEAIPGRLEQIWADSAATGRNPAEVADAMAQKLIGR